MKLIFSMATSAFLRVGIPSAASSNLYNTLNRTKCHMVYICYNLLLTAARTLYAQVKISGKHWKWNGLGNNHHNNIPSKTTNQASLWDMYAAMLLNIHCARWETRTGGFWIRGLARTARQRDIMRETGTPMSSRRLILWRILRLTMNNSRAVVIYKQHMSGLMRRAADHSPAQARAICTICLTGIIACCICMRCVRD